MKESVKGETPVTPDGPTPNPERLSDGQHADHWILSDQERASGFVRPVRDTYTHERCGTVTRMPMKIAETYAAQPSFYGSTFCAACHDYFLVGVDGEFVWEHTKEKVGT